VTVLAQSNSVYIMEYMWLHINKKIVGILIFISLVGIMSEYLLNVNIVSVLTKIEVQGCV